MRIHEHLQKLTKVERKKHHPLLHHLHKKYKISRKTLFYVKEYGPHTNVTRTILKESIRIILFASILSSIGGFALENIKTIFISMMPLIILIPTLNEMIGGYGSIISSKFSTLLHESKIKNKWWLNKDLGKLFLQILIISAFTTIASVGMALLISHLSNNPASTAIAYKIFLITLIDVAILVSILFFIAITAGLYIYKKQEDPNNFLIPITTAIADLGNMIALSVLVTLFF